jgi:hypothetical protein
MDQACPGSDVGSGTGFGHCHPKRFPGMKCGQGPHSRHFKGLLALAKLLTELVSTRPNLVSHILTE